MEEPRLHSEIGQRKVISVPERGCVDIPQTTWEQLESDEGLQLLLDRGVLAASILSGRGVRLHGSCYVGRAQCGDLSLELREKIEGALLCLLRHATRDAFRVERADAPVSELGQLAALLVRQFLKSATAYASRGRNFRYTVNRQTGSLVGGRLDITRSVQLRARGLRHLLVFEKNAVSYKTQVNRIVLAALREVEQLAHLIRISPDDVACARGLSMLFADCRDAEILFGRRISLVDQARALLDAPVPSPVKDMIALAAVLLAHESFEHSAENQVTVPRTWFLNLETLFETAVRNELQDTLSPSHHRVSRGGKHRKRVFASVTTEYSAYPDLVVMRAGVVEAIGDVKYKTWEASAIAGDVYQLLVHAAAFECNRAFLVFPSNRYECRRLGAAATGCSVTLFAADVRNLHRDLVAVAKEMGLTAADPTMPLGWQKLENRPDTL